MDKPKATKTKHKDGGQEEAATNGGYAMQPLLCEG